MKSFRSTNFRFLFLSKRFNSSWNPTKSIQSSMLLASFRNFLLNSACFLFKFSCKTSVLISSFIVLVFFASSVKISRFPKSKSTCCLTLIGAFFCFEGSVHLIDALILFSTAFSAFSGLNDLN